MLYTYPSIDLDTKGSRKFKPIVLVLIFLSTSTYNLRLSVKLINLSLWNKLNIRRLLVLVLILRIWVRLENTILFPRQPFFWLGNDRMDDAYD